MESTYFNKISRIVGPKEFLRIAKRNKILRSKLIPPRIGSDNFGMFEIVYKNEPSENKFVKK